MSYQKSYETLGMGDLSRRRNISEIGWSGCGRCGSDCCLHGNYYSLDCASRSDRLHSIADAEIVFNHSVGHLDCHTHC